MHLLKAAAYTPFISEQGKSRNVAPQSSVRQIYFDSDKKGTMLVDNKVRGYDIYITDIDVLRAYKHELLRVQLKLTTDDLRITNTTKRNELKEPNDRVHSLKGAWTELEKFIMLVTPYQDLHGPTGL